jgi:fructosamine-3-kinase
VPGHYPKILDELGCGAPVRLTRQGGGCIADAAVAVFADGSQVFVKQSAARPGMFAAEAEGLKALAAAQAIRVPHVLAVAEEALVLELIEAAPRRRGFAEDFGRRFAALHGRRGKACGFPQDNFIGATHQPNRPLDADWDEAAPDDGSGWPEFFLERRLRHQARLAAGAATAANSRGCWTGRRRAWSNCSAPRSRRRACCTATCGAATISSTNSAKPA